MGNSVFDYIQDCAFANGKKCVALTEKRCPGCVFRKTQEELIAGREKAAKRIKTLPTERQKQICDSYYNKTAQKY